MKIFVPIRFFIFSISCFNIKHGQIFCSQGFIGMGELSNGSKLYNQIFKSFLKKKNKKPQNNKHTPAYPVMPVKCCEIEIFKFLGLKLRLGQKVLIGG